MCEKEIEKDTCTDLCSVFADDCVQICMCIGNGAMSGMVYYLRKYVCGHSMPLAGDICSSSSLATSPTICDACVGESLMGHPLIWQDIFDLPPF
jgi:hypothetical protein